METLYEWNLGHGLSRLRFVVGRDSIFQIQHTTVDGELRRFLDLAQAIAGQEGAVR
jgi:hypothetical protein